MLKLKSLLPFLFALALLGCADNTYKDELLLHVPSPEWSDQVIYFIMTDRFNDGDLGNSDQGQGEYDPTDGERFSGGDLQGIIDKLDYIQGLGATAIWITPPVRNTNWDVDSLYSGYHGYHATNFMEVDPHFGDLALYKKLSSELHKRGMYLIQDVVTNHTANLFRYTGEYDAADPAKNVLVASEVPTQEPFNLNDPRRAEDRERGVYNFTPAIFDYSDSLQVLTWGMGGLDDLNTMNPEVRRALKKSYRFWIEEVGVDAFRFDTPVYVEHDFWHDFMHNPNPEERGMLASAASVGRNDFFNFGETWYHSQPYSDEAILKSAKFLGTAEKPEMASVLNFPLQQTMLKVFAGGAAPDQLNYVLQRNWEIYERPDRLVNFIDNHDMARFRSGASQEAYEQSMFMLMTLPGVPTIYYGTEQNFLEPRSSMFASGHLSGGKSHFDTKSRDYQFIQSLAQLRQSREVFRNGRVEPLGAYSEGPGWLAYKLANEEEELVCLYNTSEQPIVTEGFRLPGATAELEVIHTHGMPDAAGKKFQTDPSTGELLLLMPPRSVVILQAEEASTSEEFIAGQELYCLQFDQVMQVECKGTAEADRLWTINGRLVEPLKQRVEADRTTVELPLLTTAGEIEIGLYESHKYELGDGALSLVPVIRLGRSAQPVNFSRRKLIATDDPEGDDNGPAGNYTYPTDPTFERNNDIARVEVDAEGSNLIITTTMHYPISQIWKPVNGFDHLQLSIYLDFKEGGAADLPLRNAEMPDQRAWDLFAFAAGWGSGIQVSEGASATKAGKSFFMAPKITVRKEQQQLIMEIPAVAFGEVQDFENLGIYVVAWDGGGVGELRAIKEVAEGFSYGGAEGPGAARIMDDVWLKLSEE